jgi:dihydrofolate reductase
MAGKLKFGISMSLDGYVAGPNQSVENPLGEGGEALHEWFFATQTFQEMYGSGSGSTDLDDEQARMWNENVGAVIMGRNMFGPIRGEWPDDEWKGWWGSEPPYHTPVFVLTHHAREPLVCEGGTTFTFIGDGIESALEQAREAAGGKDVSLAGGAEAARQYLAADLVDAMEISLVPIFLGDGERLFDGLGQGRPALAHARTVDAPGVTHLKFERG